MAKKKEEVKVETVEVAETVNPELEAKERFIMRKLTVINKMHDHAKAKRLAERVLMNNK